MRAKFILKLEGIKGESAIDGHKDEIELQSFQWGASNVGSSGRSTGGGMGKAHVNDLNITKELDKASTDILLALLSHKHVSKATIYCYKSGEKPLNHYKIDMDDVVFSSYSISGGGDGALFENVGLNFSKFKVEYFTQDKAGKKGSGGNMGWDIAADKKA
jgi:type VI secretion system secreted protein Hcp